MLGSNQNIMKNYIRLYLAILIVSIHVNVRANKESIPPNTRQKEELTFTASYSMSGLMTDIAQIKMQTTPVATKTKKLLHLKCTARTFSRWDSYFKIRDLYEAYVTPQDLKPLLFKRNISEGGYEKQLKYIFNRKLQIAQTTKTKKSGSTNRDVKINNDVRDIVSAIYKLRLMNDSDFTNQKVIKQEVLVDQKVQNIYISYKGKETINSTAYGNKPCYKYSISFDKNQLENLQGNKYIWITADHNRLPLQIQAEIPLGKVQVRLTNYN